jgi:Fe-S-cluster containining protein
MVDGDAGNDPDLAAGDFSTWLTDMRAALRGERDADVPCGGCTACCTSSQFVHIEPDETDTLAHVPAGLLFPAPRLPRGHVLLGFDERGHCPMLVDGRCSIYEHRPRTCRTYDCRVFPASGVEADQPAIAARARRWRFAFPSEADRADHAAVSAVARSLDDRSGSAIGLAVRAVDRRS